MGFEPGHQKVGGRKKGTPNKAASEAREIVEKILGKSIPARLLELSKTPKEEREVLLSLLPYTYNKLQAIEVSGDMSHALDEAQVQAYKEWFMRLIEMEKA